MSLKTRLVLLVLGSIFLLAVLSHFIFNLTVFHFFEEANLIGTEVGGHLRQHIVLFVICMLAAMTGVGILLYLFLNTFITRRVAIVSQDLKQIRGLEDLSTRIPEDVKNDELSALISNLNAMLDQLENENTRRRTVENALVTSEKLASIGRLAASIAHEINNPVMAISNCLQVIKKDCRGGTAEIRDAVAISDGEINRVRNIVSGLLDFHRMDRAEFKPVDLKRVIRQAIEMLEWGRKVDGLKIEFRMNEDLSVSGAEGKLEQVFINLILNSAEATNTQGGRLTIHTTSSNNPGYVDIHITDNGPGIPPEMKHTLFEPFVTTKGNQGVGLGLYVSQKIIESHEGRIYYDDAHAQGAHFIVSLPVSRGIPSQDTRRTRF